MKQRKQRMIWCWMLMICLSLSVVGVGICSRRQETVTAASIVSWGTRGSLVRQVQQRLGELGYNVGTPDGIYGTNTYNAIVQFQRDNNLTPDGIAGAATLQALGISGDGTQELDNGYTEDDVYILASAINGEARGEPYEGQVAVGAVILNRVDSDQFPNSIPGVVYQSGAFDAVADGQIQLTPNDSAFRAAQDAINGWDPTNGALYYWNPATATSRWIWSVPITTSIGRHVFGVK